MRRIWTVASIVALAGCLPTATETASTTASSAPPSELQALRSALDDFTRRDAALQAYLAAAPAQIDAWRAAATALEARLEPLWRSLPEDAPRVAASSPEAVAAQEQAPARPTPPPSRCGEGTCCAPSPPPPRGPTVRPDGVIVLEPTCGLRGQILLPAILWEPRRASVDIASNGAAILQAIDEGEAARAGALAGVLIAELRLRREELTHARGDTENDETPCSGVEELLVELTTLPATTAEARRLRSSCLARRPQAQENLRGALEDSAMAGDPEALFRLALHDREQGELERALATLDRMPATAPPRYLVAARTLAALDAYRLDRYDHAMVELSAADLASASSDDALAEIISMLFATNVIDWREAVDHDDWPSLLPSAPLIPLADRQGCNALEVLGAHLAGTTAYLPALEKLGELSMALALYHEAIEASRALLELEPPAELNVRAQGRIYDSYVRLREFDAAIEEAHRIARELGPSSAWARDHAGEETALTAARRLIERTNPSVSHDAAPTIVGAGIVDRQSVLRTVEPHGDALAVCLWGGGAGLLWARVGLRVTVAGRLVVEEVASVWESEAVASCLVEGLSELETAPAEGGDVTLDLWIVAP